MGLYSDRLQGGSGGKWQTPHQKAMAAATSHHGGEKIEPGDMGIWATCVKGKEGAATEELKGLFEEVCLPLWMWATRCFIVLTPASMQNVSMKSWRARSCQRRSKMKSLTSSPRFRGRLTLLLRSTDQQSCSHQFILTCIVCYFSKQDPRLYQ